MGKDVKESIPNDIYNENEIKGVFGAYDTNLKMIEKLCGVNIRITTTEIEILGNGAGFAKTLISSLVDAYRRGETIDGLAVGRYYDMLIDAPNEIQSIVSTPVCANAFGKNIFAKTVNQKAFVNAVKNNLLTFAIGPAGTGKTYLAVAMAANAVKKGEQSKIILTRPAIEAGEKLGFLPGDLQMKVDPYLRPLYDALSEMFGADYTKLIERGVVEIAPLAYMRGRTLTKSFIILDEAQNTTPEQMKMFLTRFGEGSRAIVTGDDTQIDLKGSPSGLIDAQRVLQNVDSIAFVKLTGKDVVRHDLVQKIVDAYDRDSKTKK